MNADVKALWVADLRANGDKQGRQALCRDGKYCCLGRLCELAVVAGVVERKSQSSSVGYGGEQLLPPPEVMKWAGFNEDTPVIIRGVPQSLYWHNDAGRTFAEIANAIEAQL